MGQYTKQEVTRLSLAVKAKDKRIETLSSRLVELIVLALIGFGGMVYFLLSVKEC